jgi:gas vesicle protein
MGQTADELREQVEAQRNELGRDLEVLGDRVSPGRMVERRKASVRQRFTKVKESVMGAADSVPSPAGAFAGDSGQQPGLADRTADMASSVAGRVGATPDAVRSGTSGNPLGAGLLAFGAGMLLGSMLPESQKERQVAQQATPTLQRVAGEAGTLAREAADDLKPVAQEAAQDLQDSAKSSAETVKDEAQQAAQDVQETAKQSAGDVASTASEKAESVKGQTQA